MANGQTFTLNFDAKLNVSQMKGAIGNIQSELNRLQLPQNLTKGITGTLASLEKELRNFEVAAGRDLSQKKNFSAFERSAERIQSLFKDISIQSRDLGKGVDLSKFIPDDASAKIKKAQEAIDNYTDAIKRMSSQEKRAETSIRGKEAKQTVFKEELEELKGRIEEYNKTRNTLLADIFKSVGMGGKDTSNIDNIETAFKAFEKLQQVMEAVASGKATKADGSLFSDEEIQKAQQAINKIKELKQKYDGVNESIKNATAAQKSSQDGYDKIAKEIDKAKKALDELKKINASEAQSAIQKVFAELNKQGFDTSKFQQNIDGAKQALEAFKASATGNIAQALNNITQVIGNMSPAVEKLRSDTDGARDSFDQFEAQTRDISAVKSRIQYFFGLTNAINLARRAIRGAIETVKELDKAMTETAVVTSNTVSDMWAKLPEYTKRANELGVSTLEAYQAATLYYQQGLNDDQAAALSVETLKMARIAGLEAADATDRMTNALRGFNMELNEVSAQKVDDVYSQLAAMSASNVDEISTAMTKVASLAHNANMEFETTAAFLAQIIETTRESAETAGTALKTVVARFSEVKKLYDMNELKGTDEEGQIIDVNKVGAALRTAGIDLNKYFLGEVGLDDIFMELASKWDSLTSVQQRYIATQAAGSRQQSRFIALMQDYARTQQLVSAAYNANGASAKQFEKTQESLQSKLARLKNAWNEFLMGLANNSIIKGAVDLLTLLLNVVNKLTSAFGTGVGFVLKWVTAFSAFAGIKSLFRGGGLVDKGLMTVLKGTGLGNALTKAGILSGATFGSPVDTGAVYSKSGKLIGHRLGSATGTTGAAGGSFLGSLLGKAGAGFTKLGNKALAGQAGLFGKIGTKIAGSGSTAMLSGIATALSAVVVAVTAALVIYGAWRKFSPEGQLKTAKKEAEKANKEAEKAQEDYKKLNSLQDTYKEKTEEINKTTNAQDRQAAIERRNEAILDAIKEDGTLAQYVVTESVDNEIVLKVDEASLAEAAEKASEVAADAAVKARFGEANVDIKQGNVAKSQLERLYRRVTNENPDFLSAEQIYKKIIANNNISDAQRSKAADYYLQYTNSRGAAEQQAKLAYGQQLSRLKVNDEIVNNLMPILSKIFVETGKQFNDTDLEGFAKIGKSDNGKALLQILNGTYDEQISIDEVKEKFDSLSQEQQDSIKILLNTAGKSIEETYEALEKYAISIQKSQKEFRKKATATLKKGGISDNELLDQISNNLKISEQEKLVEFSESLSDYGSEFSGIILTRLSEAMLDGDYDKVFASFATSLSDNPILTLEALRDAAKNGNKEVKELIASLGLLDESGDINSSKYQVFSKENLVQFYLASDEYNNLTESIEKFIEENGQINSHNIKELASESKSLQVLLDNNIISANGLSNAINALSQGNITIFDLNSNVLNLYESFDSVANAISRAGALIKNFDPGEDWGDAFDFIGSGIEKMSELVGNRELGNPQLRNYWSTFFNGPTPTDLAGWESGIAILKEMQANSGADFWTKAVGFTMDENGNIADMGVQDFANSDFSSYTDYIKSLVDSKYNFSDNFYDLMLRNMGNHDYGVMKEIGAVETQKIIEAYGASAPTQKDIQAIADAYGLKPQDVLDAWTEKYNNGEQIDFTQLQESIRRTTTAAKDVLEKEWKQGRRDIGDTESEINRSWETQSQDTGWILSQLGANSDGTFSVDTLYAKIGKIVPEVADGTMSAAEWIQEQIDNSPEGEITLPVTYQVTSKTGEENGKPIFETETIETEVTVSNLQEYQAAVNQLQQAADQQMLGESLVQPLTDAETKAQAISQTLAELGLQTDLSNITSQIEGAEDEATTLHNNLSATATKYVKIVPLQSSISISGDGGSVSFTISAVAKGGIVQSYASGPINSIKPGLALTGEEAPEIVWNKEKGYAYLAGKDGPEINNLQPGDQVFNGNQTKQILKRSGISSFAKGTIGSYAGTTWKIDDPPSKTSGGGGSGGSDDKTPDEWKNDLDWLYNLMEDIAELERDQKAIEERYEDYLSDQSKTGGDLYKLLVQQLGNLYTQLNHQTFALEKREQEMREFMDVTNDQDQYLQYNWEDRTLEIDWDAIDQITDEEQYKHIKELIDEAESIQDKMDDADDAVMDITNQIQELENVWRDTYVDFEGRVLDALVKSYQQVIDKYSELNTTLNDSNAQILDSLQKQISLERQIRDNTKTEEQISDSEARLAYLRRDTSGGNELAALQLERELADQRESYEDTLVDQAISRLQEDNDAAAQQRERQIEIMQAQLDYQSENGEFNAYIKELLTSAMGADGELLTNSDLMNLLKEQENWDAMSDVNKEVWEEELNTTFKEVAAFLLKQNAEENGTFYTALTAAVESVSAAIGSYSQAMVKLGSEISSAGSSGGGGSSDSSQYIKPPQSDTTPKPRIGGGCFAPGTKILMSDYSLSNIETVKIGDVVIAYNEQTQQFVPKKVTKSYIHHNTPAIVRLIFTDNSILELTPGHPLYSIDGWKSLDIENSLYEHNTIATLLHIGDEIIGINGNKIVKTIEWLAIDVNYDSYNIEVEDCHTFLANGLVAHNAKAMHMFATGGLADSTGLAWLDGTPSEPEYVLNARQTEAFLKLSDVLPSMMDNIASMTQNTFGDTYVNLSVNLESVSPDYDVDRMVDLVKDKLYDVGSYRNVNSLSFLR